MSDLAKQLEQEFEALFKKTALPPLLKKAAAYAFFPGGKRFRPLLALQVAASFRPIKRGWDVVLALDWLTPTL